MDTRDRLSRRPASGWTTTDEPRAASQSQEVVRAHCVDEGDFVNGGAGAQFFDSLPKCEAELLHSRSAILKKLVGADGLGWRNPILRFLPGLPMLAQVRKSAKAFKVFAAVKQLDRNILNGSASELFIISFGQILANHRVPFGSQEPGETRL